MNAIIEIFIEFKGEEIRFFMLVEILNQSPVAIRIADYEYEMLQKMGVPLTKY